MIKIYTLCNAHLDPVWLWHKEEGMAEALSTFRVAADFCEKYDGFIFNHNESVLYEWVEEYEPELFRRIQALVKQGRWRIMGGWYLQPDCVMPSGESFIRQIETGNRYFKEKFDYTPETAVNFDPFGHTRGLVQILKKYGYKNYLFMRPSNAAPAENFIWKGYDGSEIQAHSLQGGYSSAKRDSVKKLEWLLKEPEDKMLMCWGVGDHGGGPSEEAWQDLMKYKASHPEIEIISSGCEEFFDAVKDDSLPVFEKSLVHCMVGCYTTMARVKQNHRKLENTLEACEKMITASGIDFDSGEMLEAQKALLFSEFHDSLPGTMIRKGEEEILQLQSHGLEILSKYMTKSFFKLCDGQQIAKRGEIPIEVFNPNPYKITQDVEIEFQLEEQNWNDGEYTTAKVRSESGKYLPTQNIKEDSMLNLDWRKRIVFTAELEPMSITRFDCELSVEKHEGRPVQKCEENGSRIVFDNGSMLVEISKLTGLIDKYSVNGEDKLLRDSAKICVFRDNEDPWGMETDGFYDKIGEFTLLSDEQANRFNGFENEKKPNVRIIENGNVRMSVQAIFAYEQSFAVITYILPKNHNYIDIQITLYSNNANKMYKLSLPTAFKNSRFTGQMPFGSEELLKEKKEVFYHKWCALLSDEGSLAVINDGTYGGSCDENTMYISLLRTPVYSAHPIGERQLAETDRNHDHIDMGVRKFRYRITAETENIDAQAQIYNQPVFALPFFPSGRGEKKNTACELDNEKLILTRYSTSSDSVITARVFNPSDSREKGTLATPFGRAEIDLGAYEFETYYFKK